MTLPASSFRDPSGNCLIFPNVVYRLLEPASADICDSFLQTECAQQFLANGQLISTRRLSESELARLNEIDALRDLLSSRDGRPVLEHGRVPFISYPYEWPAEMLWEAARLTLELAQGALKEGFGLKDATPYNVLYRGPNPVFVDIPSFEKRDPGDPVWLAQGQFVRTFLLPLLANQRWGLALAEIFTNHRDGLEPEYVYRWCGILERLKPRTMSLVSIPAWLKGKAKAKGTRLYESKRMDNPEKARFILDSLLRRAEKTLQSLKPRGQRNSVWADYMDTHSYAETEFAEKEKFVDDVLREMKPRRVLDIGANTGHFSLRAAKAGAEVVSIDIDPACVDQIWGHANREKLNILPLVVDLSRPSPALGWKNTECVSFLERSRGAFDCLFMLAVVHHLILTERVPLEQVILLASEITTAWLVIEYVGPEDEMFRQLTRGRGALHKDLSEKKFEETCARHFDIVRSQPSVGKARRLYLLKRKG